MEPITIAKFPATEQQIIDLQCPRMLSIIPTKRKSFSSRIGAGNKATQHEFPFAVKFITEEVPEVEKVPDLRHCGGSLLTDRHILTHAYCIRHDKRREPQSKSKKIKRIIQTF